MEILAAGFQTGFAPKLRHVASDLFYFSRDTTALCKRIRNFQLSFVIL